MAEYELLKEEGRAKRGVFHTVHGDIQTPVFMNVGTVAAIKGAVSTQDLKDVKCQVELSNTYHLHVRTGDKLIKEVGNKIVIGVDSHNPIEFDDYEEYQKAVDFANEHNIKVEERIIFDK